MANTAERTFPIRLCTVVSPSGSKLEPWVRCPRRDATIDAHTCAGCMRMRSLEWDPEAGGEVGCFVESPVPTFDPRADFAELAARTRMHEIGARVVTFVMASVRVSELRPFFDKCETLAVVDVEGRLEGLVTRSRLAVAPDDGMVHDIMEPCAHSLPEDAPVSLALSLFAVEKLSAAPIVKADGVVTGMCFADDLLRWVATQLGYATKR